MRYQPALPLIYNETRDTLAAALAAAGFPAFRTGQLLHWLYRQRADSWNVMVNLPLALRSWLAEHYTLNPAREVLVKRSSDVTEKLLLEMGDRALVETVLIRYPQEGVGLDQSRKTICVSSQIGCAYGCVFCASGLAGWRRDLLGGEIVAQLLHVTRLEEARDGGRPDFVPFDNIVYMGMGEPLANYDAVLHSIRVLHAAWGLHFGARRITVSTSGLVPQILKLAAEPIGVRLALSLHGATNEVRDRIMPVNRKYPLEQLLPAVAAFAERHGRMVTLEYILIDDVNDSFEQANALADIGRRLHAHVNLIPYNKVDGLPWQRPNIKRQLAFARILRDAGVSHTVRKEKGHDIDAACGQLRLQAERDRTGITSV
jgi:23S rRNA (adenine2503-C2)-methyltransferase